MAAKKVRAHAFGQVNISDNQDDAMSSVRPAGGAQYFPSSDFSLTLRKIERPFSADPVGQFDWICASLGFLEPIDKKKTASLILREIVRATEERRPLTSAQLSSSVKMSRGSVVNHLNNLLASGLIVRQGRYYAARSRSMSRIISEIEADCARIFAGLRDAGAKIDRELGISDANRRAE